MFKGIKTFFGSTHKFYVALFFASYRVLRGRAWELLTNSPGRDFMSGIGLVQAAMKEVDKISKSNA